MAATGSKRGRCGQRASGHLRQRLRVYFTPRVQSGARSGIVVLRVYRLENEVYRGHCGERASGHLRHRVYFTPRVQSGARSRIVLRVYRLENEVLTLARWHGDTAGNNPSDLVVLLGPAPVLCGHGRAAERSLRGNHRS